MAGLITVFGATGYTGRRVARALVRDGVRPTLAGRSRERLLELADELGGLDIVVADAQSPDGTVRDLLDAGDVLISTVGPFLRHGGPALHAAVRAGAHYLDSTGEPPWLRRVFDVYGPQASGRCAVVPAIGYDFVPGNLAAGLALREAGDEAVRVDVGYFADAADGEDPQPTRGTAASATEVLFEPAYAWRGGRLIEVRTADRVGTFEIDGRDLDAVSYAGTEHLSLPRLWPQLDEVNVYIGWLGPWAQQGSRLAAVPYALRHVPGIRRFATVVGDLVADAIGASADDEEGSGGLGRIRVVAVAYDRGGEQLAEVQLAGSEAYRFTGHILAWAAQRAADGEILTTGAIGPVEAFGLDELLAACSAAGLERV